MDGPNYHGEIRTEVTDRRQALSIDVLLRPYKDGFGNVVSLSLWNPDDYDPAAVIDLSLRDARTLAEQLRKAADALAAGSSRTLYPVPA